MVHIEKTPKIQCTSFIVLNFGLQLFDLSNDGLFVIRFLCSFYME